MLLIVGDNFDLLKLKTGIKIRSWESLPEPSSTAAVIMATPWDRIIDDSYRQWLEKAMTPEEYNNSSIRERRGLLTDFATPWDRITDDSYRQWLVNRQVSADEFNEIPVLERSDLRTRFEQQQQQPEDIKEVKEEIKEVKVEIKEVDVKIGRNEKDTDGKKALQKEKAALREKENKLHDRLNILLQQAALREKKADAAKW